METKSAIKVDVNVESKDPLLGFLNTAGFVNIVVISQTLEDEEFIVNEKGGNAMSLGVFPGPSSYSPPKVLVQLETFRPDYVYETLNERLHEHVLSQKVSDEIAVKAQGRRSQGPLFMEVLVKLTRNVFNVVPGFSGLPTRDSNQQESETTCAICMEDLEDKLQLQIPNCSHWFHEDCLVEWLKRNDSCPLCRQTC